MVVGVYGSDGTKYIYSLLYYRKHDYAILYWT